MAISLSVKNNLIMRNWLWVLKGPTGFNYTDGEAAERFLKKTIAEAKDITSMSLELEAVYPEWDWVAEYHLSPRRANILRGLDFSGMRRVLEIGCGCGAITRFLGEKGLQVEAIEGAERRAEIAHLRCRDLDNVQIINANFNDLVLPENNYDAVFLIGVIEYARKFFPAAANDEDAVVQIIELLNKSLTQDGIIVIAIENRHGLKYWLGATEDHYGKPYIGISDYLGQSGIRTYTKIEWELLLEKAGIINSHFQFPFPDYKQPQVILDEDFIDKEEYAYSILYRIRSRDYLVPWHPGANEFAIWKALHKSGQLKHYANSFLILAGKESVDFSRLLPDDFIYFSGGSRKPEYRTITVKPKNKDFIKKQTLWPSKKASDGLHFMRSLDTAYIRGPLLSTIWLEAALGSDPDRLDELIRKYHRFIIKILDNKPDAFLLDALPSNIVVDDEERYHVIDLEWRARTRLTPEFLLFRSLFWFAGNNQDALSSFFREKGIACLREFVEYGFGVVSVSLRSLLEEFVTAEEKIQFDTYGQKHVCPIHEALAAPIFTPPDKMIFARLFWAADDRPFEDASSLEMVYSSKTPQPKLRYRFVSPEKISRLRFQPTSEAGFFKITAFSLTWQEGDSSGPEVLWSTDSVEDLLAKCSFSEAVLPFTAPRGVFYAMGANAAIDFPVEYLFAKDPGDGVFECAIEMAKIPAINFAWEKEVSRLAIERIASETREKIDNLSLELAEKRKEVENLKVRAKVDQHGLKVRLVEAERKNQILEDTVAATTSELASLHSLLEQLGSLKFLKGIGRLFPGKYGWITGKLARYTHKNYATEEYETICQSGLFDEAFYQSQQPDLAPFGGDSIHHYLAVGAYVGLRPNRLFDTEYYYRQVPHLKPKRINPFYHYISVGAFEDKNPCYLFDTRFYTSRNPEIMKTGQNPLKHYLKKGGKSGCDPHPAFDTVYYLEKNPDALDSELTPLEHFFTKGEQERKTPTALFDPDYYLSVRTNLLDAKISPFRHFMEYGYLEGQDPSYLFQMEHYISDDDHLRQQKVNPLVHFIAHGQFENRSPNPLFDVENYRQVMASTREAFHDPLSHYLQRGWKRGLKPHPLFATDFYREQIFASGQGEPEPLEHYFRYGITERLDPHPLFSCGYYLSQFNDGELDSDDLLLYYLNHGADEDRDPHPLFSTKFYRTQIRKADPCDSPSLAHYLRKGCGEGLSTHPEFDVAHYKKVNAEVFGSAAIDPIEHYIYHGSQNEKWPSREIEGLVHKPRISFACVVDGPDFRYLPGLVLSAMSQLYPIWDFSIVVRNPDESAGYQRLRSLAANDKRIQLVEADDSTPVSALLNDVLLSLSGEYIVFFDERMFFHADLLLTFVRKLNQDRTLSLIHTGRGANDRNLIRVARLCPGSDAHTVRFFIGPPACFKRSIIDAVGGFESWHQGAYDERFLIQYIRQCPARTIVHIPYSLHFTMYHDPLRIDVRKK